MIITCDQCNKKFDVKDVLIPAQGRLLECSSCLHKWFYKKPEINENTIIQNLEIKSNDITKKNVVESSKNIITDNLEIIINDTSKAEKKNDKELFEKKIIKNKNSSNVSRFLNLIIVSIISLISLVIVIDTFKTPISFFIPNIEFILNNLYQTFLDVYLFFGDLI